MSKIITVAGLQSYMSKNSSFKANIGKSVVDAVNAWIESRTHRSWGEITTITERYDWAPRIWLNHQDIVTDPGSMTVKFGYPNLQQSVLDSTSYFWNSLGRVTIYLQNPSAFNPSAVNNDLVEIQYSYGVLDVPEDLVLAALGVAAGFYNWSADNNQKDIVSTAVGTYRVQFAGAIRGALPNPAQNVADANWAIIESYCMRHI